MPRLVGKQSNASPILALALLIAVAGGVSLEYLGYTNWVPEFGRDRPSTNNQSNS